MTNGMSRLVLLLPRTVSHVGERGKDSGPRAWFQSLSLFSIDDFPAVSPKGLADSDESTFLEFLAILSFYLLKKFLEFLAIVSFVHPTPPGILSD